MAIDVGDVIEFTLKGRWGNVLETRNVFQFEVHSGAVGSPDAAFDSIKAGAQAFWTNISSAMATMTHVTQTYYQMDAKVIRGADYGVQNVYAISGFTGAASGDPSPSFVCFTFRYQGTGGAHRNGYKRFAGVAESSTTGNNVAGGVFGDLEVLAAFLADNLTAMGGLGGVVAQWVAHPVVVKKVANGINPSDIDVVDTWPPVGVIPHLQLGSQNSRKLGIGI